MVWNRGTWVARQGSARPRAPFGRALQRAHGRRSLRHAVLDVDDQPMIRLQLGWWYIVVARRTPRCFLARNRFRRLLLRSNARHRLRRLGLLCRHSSRGLRDPGRHLRRRRRLTHLLALPFGLYGRFHCILRRLPRGRRLPRCISRGQLHGRQQRRGRRCRGRRCRSLLRRTP